MRKPQGYAQVMGPPLSGPIDHAGIASLHRFGECDTFTCGHCQRVVHVPAARDPTCVGGMCTICQRLVCPECVRKQVCSPFETKLELQLRAEANRRAMRGLV